MLTHPLSRDTIGHMNRWLSSLAIALPALLMAHEAGAVRNPDYLVERPLETAQGAAGRLTRVVDYTAPKAQLGVWAAFKSRHGVAWQGMWDEATDVPVRIWGEGIAVPGANGDPAIALAASRALLDEQLALVAPGSHLDDWQVVSNVVHGRGNALRTVGFVQSYQGVPVQGGAVSFLFKNDRLFVIGSQALPSVSARIPGHAVTGSAATAKAVEWITAAYRARPTVLSEGALSILPLIRESEDGVAQVEYRAVKTVVLDLAEPRARWNVFVDAETGEPLARTQTLRFGSGVLKYNTPVRYPGGGRQDFVAAFANLTIGAQALTTDVAGAFAFTGSGQITVNATVVGPKVRVLSNGAAGGTQNINVPDGAAGGTWNAGSTATLDAQLTGFIHANLIKSFALAELNPSLGWLNDQLEVTVNENGTCNAYSSGDDIHFFAAGGGCENTGRLPDVIYHEFGHSIHNNSVIPGAGAFDSAMSEGVSDYLAATFVNDSGMGRGFFNGSPQALREIDPVGSEWMWPGDISEDPHMTGLIIAGALWDTRKALVAELGDTAGRRLADDFYYATLQRASDIPTTYVEVLAFDDDDGNLANGTPHKCTVDAAFTPHGLVDPQLGIGIGVPTRDGYNVALAIAQPAGGCDAPDVTGVTVDWKPRGGNLQQIALTRTADVFAAAIPTQPDDTVVEYRVVVTLQGGTTITYPNNAGDPLYQFYVGPLTPVYCTDFESDPFAAGWTHSAQSGTDDWQWGSPNGDSGNGDPIAAASGANVVGQDLGIGGNRDGAYARNSIETLTSPEIDVTGRTGVRLQLKRWLSVEDGFYDQASISADGEEVWHNFTGPDQNASTHTLDREWRFFDVDLGTQAADGKVQVSFTLEADQGLQYGGWTIDDFCIMARGTGPALPVCGNGAIETGESCDDSNTTSGDGCSATCADETTNPGDEDGGCCSTNSDPRGALVLGLATALFFVRRRRRV